MKLHNVRIIYDNDTDMKWKADGTNGIDKFIVVYVGKFHQQHNFIVKSSSSESIKNS